MQVVTFHYCSISLSSAQQWLTHSKLCPSLPNLLIEEEIMSIFHLPSAVGILLFLMKPELGVSIFESLITLFSVTSTLAIKKTHFLNSRCCSGFPMTKKSILPSHQNTVFWWERRIGEGLLSEGYFSVSTWHGLQFQRSVSFIDEWL